MKKKHQFETNDKNIDKKNDDKKNDDKKDNDKKNDIFEIKNRRQMIAMIDDIDNIYLRQFLFNVYH